MLGPHDPGDVVTEALRERGRGAACRDRDRDRVLAMDGREDERAELRHVDDVAEKRARLGVTEDASVHGRRRGGGDDEEPAVEVVGPVAASHER